jgi:transposase
LEVEMDVIVERQAALDVHKEQVTACVRVPDEQGEQVSHVAEFKTTVRGLLALRRLAEGSAVTQVTMEATGVYWKPVWHLLEDEFELVLVNASHVKQVPGRKTDVSDAVWLCQLAEAGLLRASFVVGLCGRGLDPAGARAQCEHDRELIRRTRA